MLKEFKYFFIGYLLLLISIRSQAQNHVIDSLEKNIRSNLNDTALINTMNRLSWEFINNGEYIKADSLASNAMKMSNEFLAGENFKNDKIISDRLKKAIAKSHCNIGVALDYRGYYQPAIDHYLKALEIYNRYQDKTGIAISYDYLGNAYTAQGSYHKALEYFFKALEINEEIKNKGMIAGTFNNIAIVYSSLADYPKALKYFFESLKIVEALGDKRSVAIKICNIGSVYHNQGDYRGALKYYYKALKMAEELGDKNIIAANLGDIATAYDDEHMDERALEFYFKALKLNREFGIKDGILSNLGNMGLLYTRQKKYSEAESCLTKALSVSMEIGDLDAIQDNHGSLSQLYATQKKWQKAKYHYKNYINAKDSIYNLENAKISMRAEMNHEFNKKTKEAKLLQEKMDAISEMRSGRQKFTIGAVCILLVLVICFALYILKSILQKKKINSEIIEQKKVIEEKQKEIMDSIHYAERIQRSLITPEKYIETNIVRLKRPGTAA